MFGLSFSFTTGEHRPQTLPKLTNETTSDTSNNSTNPSPYLVFFRMRLFILTRCPSETNQRICFSKLYVDCPELNFRWTISAHSTPGSARSGCVYAPRFLIRLSAQFLSLRGYCCGGSDGSRGMTPAEPSVSYLYLRAPRWWETWPSADCVQACVAT